VIPVLAAFGSDDYGWANGNEPLSPVVVAGVRAPDRQQTARHNQEAIMKRLLIAATLVAAAMMTVGASPRHTTADAKGNDRATIELTETVKLMNVILRGQYLVVHDEALMAKGEACTYLYDKSGKLVVSFHCTPIERPRADRFRMVTRRLNPSGLSELVEIQFAGTTEAHLVP